MEYPIYSLYGREFIAPFQYIWSLFNFQSLNYFVEVEMSEGDSEVCVKMNDECTLVTIQDQLLFTHRSPQ